MRTGTRQFETPMLGKIEGRRRWGRQDEMVGWHHQLNGCKFAQTLGNGGVQGSLVCCSPWGCKESGMTERLNNNSKSDSRVQVLDHYTIVTQWINDGWMHGAISKWFIQRKTQKSPVRKYFLYE